MHLTKNKKIDRHVYLLYIQDRYFNEDDEWNVERNEPIKYHYVLISDLSRLLADQFSAHHGRKYYCDRCLNLLISSYHFDRHLERCLAINSCRVILPQKE